MSEDMASGQRGSVGAAGSAWSSGGVLRDIIAPQYTTVEPEAFQARLIDALTATLLREGAPPCLLRAPTGAGKTLVITRSIDRISELSPTLWLWFVPFVNLVQQTEDAIATNGTGLVPVSLERGRNQAPVGGMVVISTAAAVARARSRTVGYADDADDDMRSLSDQVSLARARGLKIGLVVDEAHIGLDSQTEFGRFAHWLKPDRLLMASATPKDDRLAQFLAAAGFSAFESFSVARDDVVMARLNKRYVQAVVYSLSDSIAAITDLELTVLRQAWRRSVRLRTALEADGIPVKPLLLVQVANGAGTIAAAREALMRMCAVPAEAIGEHSSDAPDPVLMSSIANNTTKEVLIFKQSAGTGFDAPRAFVLASLKPVNDPDFAMQFLGRIMRVHRAMRRHFPRGEPMPAEFDTAFVYLANAQAQAGFEQAVSATANLHSELEGQSERLVARRTSAGAVVYTNRTTDEPELALAAQYLAGDDVGRGGAGDADLSPARAGRGSNGSLPGIVIPERGVTAGLFSTSDLPDDGLDEVEVSPVGDREGSRSGTGGALSWRGAGAAGLPEGAPSRAPRTRKGLVQVLAGAGIRAYPRRSMKGAPPFLLQEERPVMADMADAARNAAARLDISPALQRAAVAVALGKAVEREILKELYSGDVKESRVAIVIERAVLGRRARETLEQLPQAEEADIAEIVDVLTKRATPWIEEQFAADETPPAAAQIRRQARDAAFWVAYRSFEALSELLHAEIASQARSVNAQPLPDMMLFPESLPLEQSTKNLYGAMPPGKEDLDRVERVLTIDARQLMREREVAIGSEPLRLASYDGAHMLGREEREFAVALDRASFVHWWHRNPDRKGYSARLVRGESRNYFYPDFIVCLEHFPGDEPLMRLVETKHDTKDAARKSRHPSSLYGKVLFLTRDQRAMRWINDDGSLGRVVDLDDLEGMRDWLRATRPAAG